MGSSSSGSGSSEPGPYPGRVGHGTAQFLQQATETRWNLASGGRQRLWASRKQSSTEKSTRSTTLGTHQTRGSRRSLLRSSPQGSANRFLQGLQWSRRSSHNYSLPPFLAASRCTLAAIRTSRGRISAGLVLPVLPGFGCCVRLPCCCWRRYGNVGLQLPSLSADASVCGLHLLLHQRVLFFAALALASPGCALRVGWLAYPRFPSLCVGLCSLQRYESQRWGAFKPRQRRPVRYLCPSCTTSACVGFSAFLKPFGCRHCRHLIREGALPAAGTSCAFLGCLPTALSMQRQRVCLPLAQAIVSSWLELQRAARWLFQAMQSAGACAPAALLAFGGICLAEAVRAHLRAFSGPCLRFGALFCVTGFFRLRGPC